MGKESDQCRLLIIDVSHWTFLASNSLFILRLIEVVHHLLMKLVEII